MPDPIDPTEKSSTTPGTDDSLLLDDSAFGELLLELGFTEEEWNHVSALTTEELDELGKEVERERLSQSESRPPSIRESLGRSSGGTTPTVSQSVTRKLSVSDLSGDDFEDVPQTMQRLRQQHEDSLGEEFDVDLREMEELLLSLEEVTPQGGDTTIKTGALTSSLRRSVEDNGHFSGGDLDELADLQLKAREARLSVSDLELTEDLDELDRLLDELREQYGPPSTGLVQVPPLPLTPEERVFQAAVKKLYYTPLTDEQKLTASPEELKEDTRLKTHSDAIGAEVFRDVEGSGLTAEQKQRIHVRLAEHGMKQELESPGVKTNPNTLLRGNSRYTHYVGAYLQVYAKGYVDSVRNSVMGEAAKISPPPSIQGLAGSCFKVVEGAYTKIEPGALRDSLKEILRKHNAPEEFVKEIDEMFWDKTGTAVSLRAVDQDLERDIDEFLRLNGAETGLQDEVTGAFRNFHASKEKVARLVNGGIPPEDLPPDGLLISYLKMHGLTAGLQPEEMNRIKSVRIDDFQSMQRAQTSVASTMMGATARNVGDLSPQGRQFLNAAFNPVTDPGARNVAGASTLLLRFISPRISSEASYLSNDPSTDDVGAVLNRSAKTVQRFANSLGVGSDKQDYATLSLADLSKDDQLQQQTLQCIGAIAKGDDLDDFSRKAGGRLEIDPQVASQKTALDRIVRDGPVKLAITNAQVQPQLDRIARLEKKLDDLGNKHSFERFKAWIKGENVAQKKNLIINEIDDLKLQVMRKVDREGYNELGRSNDTAFQQIDREMRELNHRDPHTLEGALAIPEMRKAFHEQATTAATEENLDLDERIEEFKLAAADPNVTDEDLLEMAREIRDTYVADDAPYRANLDDSERGPLLDALDDDGISRDRLATVFNASQNKVREYMGEDMLRKFHNSEQFKRALGKLDGDEVAFVLAAKQALLTERQSLERIRSVRRDLDNPAPKNTTGAPQNAVTGTRNRQK